MFCLILSKIIIIRQIFCELKKVHKFKKSSRIPEKDETDKIFMNLKFAQDFGKNIWKLENVWEFKNDCRFNFLTNSKKLREFSKYVHGFKKFAYSKNAHGCEKLFVNSNKIMNSKQNLESAKIFENVKTINLYKHYIKHCEQCFKIWFWNI